MNWLAYRLTLWLVETLDPHERDVFLGDQKELGSSGVRTAYEALGLVVRRAFRGSARQGPPRVAWWLVLLLSPPLIGESFSVARVLPYWSPRLLLVFPDLFTAIGIIVALLAWMLGFILGSVSSHVMRVAAEFLALAWLLLLGIAMVENDANATVMILHVVIYVLPTIVGLRSGRRRGWLTKPKAIGAAVAPPLILLWSIVSMGPGSGGPPAWVTHLLVGLVFVVISLPGAMLLYVSEWQRQTAREVAP